MQKVMVYGVRITENPLCPFGDFLLSDLGINKRVVLQTFDDIGGEADDGDEEAGNARPIPKRELWLGWLDRERKLLAGMICTPHRDRRYPAMTSDGEGRFVINLLSLSKNAKELNFFVYSFNDSALIYQHKHGTLGPEGFMNLLRPLYNEAKTAQRDEAISRLGDVRKKVKEDLTSKYHTPLRHTIVSREDALRDLVRQVRGGQLIIDTEYNHTADDPNTYGSFVDRTRTIFTLKPIADGVIDAFADAMVDVANQFKKKAKLRAKVENGEVQTIHLEEALNKLAFEQYEVEDWMKFLDGEAAFKYDTFPFDVNTNQALSPIQALHGILHARRADLAGATSRDEL